MSTEPPVPEMRAFVMSLLVVAAGDTRTNRRSLNIAENAALRYALELAGRSPELSAKATRGDRSFGGWLDGGTAPDDFFVFCGWLLDAVDRRVRGRHEKLRRAVGDEPSSYDHAALLALAQTVCRAAGVHRARFPTIDQCFQNIASEHPRDMQRTLLTNYLGNLLQDYFDESRIRAEFVSLPNDIEDSMRTEEAAELADAVFNLLSIHDASPDEPTDVSAIQRELGTVIGSVWLAERALP